MTNLIEIMHYAPRCPFELNIVDTRPAPAVYSLSQVIRIGMNVQNLLLVDRDETSPKIVTVHLNQLGYNNKSVRDAQMDTTLSIYEDGVEGTFIDAMEDVFSFRADSTN